MPERTTRTRNTRTTRARSLATIAGLAALAAGLGGCVNQGAHDDLMQENRTLTSRNTELSNRLREMEQINSGLRGDASGVAGSIASLQSERDALRSQLEQARGTILSLEDQLAGIELTRLDPVTDDALRRLADQYPDVIRYDAERGMLQFASDLTFDSGSATVKDSVRGSLQALARVLNAAAGSQYDVRIVGHTDAQRISANTAQRFPTNMHLSVARAIAVRAELMKLNVPAGKMQAAGWGEFRPAVPNTANGNTPANRRVEVFLVAGTGSAFAPSGSDASTGTGVAPDRERINARQFEPTK